MPSQKILVLYATQTGNAKGIATEMGTEMTKRGHDTRVMGMEHFKKVDFNEEPMVVVVASCTGNGDCPDNGDKFLRLCKRKTTAPMFESTKFAVCGLGDSNYDAFCAVGKEFDKHFERLGGTRLIKRVDVDEVEGIETFVEPWLDKLWTALDELPAFGDDISNGAAAKGEPVPAAAAAAPAASAAAAPKEETTLPKVGATPAVSSLVAAAAATGSSANASSANDDDDEPVGGSFLKPYTATVAAARWLTGSGDGKVRTGAAVGASEGDRAVLHIELDVTSAGEVMKFTPGDALGVVPRNEKAEVAKLVALLGLPSGGEVAMPSMGANTPLHLDGCASVVDALTRRVDIGSNASWPPMALLKLLHSSKKTPPPAGSDAILLERIATAASGSAGARAAHQALQTERPSLCELLARTKATPPPLAALLDALPPMAPRFYSIANADSGNPTSPAPRRLIHLCLSVVHYYTVGPDGERIARRGLASNMLADLCKPILAATKNGGGGGAAGVQVEVFKREPSGYELRLPSNPSTPIAMVGPGTGLAPFRGFIQERRYAYQRKQLGPSHLFFGCRTKDDFLYADELSALAGSGALSLHTAFSREGDAQAAGVWRGARINIPYVQDHIEEHGRTLCELLYKQKGHVYVCGDGQAMAKDVHEALRRATMVHEKMSEAEAEKALTKLSEEGRYSREIWN